MIRIACIVEGFGELEAVPVLIRAIAQRVNPGLQIEIPKPYRVKRQKIVKEGELEKVVQFSAGVVLGAGGIFVLLDSDDDCPAELGPTLLSRAKATRPDFPIEVVLAKQEFEAWFLASPDSIAGYKGLPDPLFVPADPESLGSPKGWLDKQFHTGGYSETIDQVKLTARLDLDAARALDSFDKCFRAVTSLINALVTEPETP